MRGRFAPSPTGPLHLGNLRTALISYLHARSLGGEWLVRVEDLDRVTSSRAHEEGQLASLAALGMVPDHPVVRQSERFDLYGAAIARLRDRDLVYECFCTRREIREAAMAPHGDLPDGAYPGTCRALTARQREAYLAAGRSPALRLRTAGDRLELVDLVAGPYGGAVDDVVLQRNDGVSAYNLAVVVDDAAQGVTHVVRGDDLLPSTPRQMLLQRLLGLPHPAYAHVPLVLGPDGTRLAKRHGAVTLDDLAAHGVSPAQVLARLLASIGVEAREARGEGLDELAAGFRLDRLPRTPWSLQPGEL